MGGSNWDSDARLNGSLALAIPDTTPPVITPRVTGQLGKNGFYTSDVHVAWDVTDLESAIAHRSGCDDASVVTTPAARRSPAARTPPAAARPRA